MQTWRGATDRHVGDKALRVLVPRAPLRFTSLRKTASSEVVCTEYYSRPLRCSFLLRSESIKNNYKIRVLLADREFIGEAWFRFLIEEKIPFVIRVKRNFMIEGIQNGYAVPIGNIVEKFRTKEKARKPKGYSLETPFICLC